VTEKRAAELTVGDGVRVARGDDRVVARIEFHDKPVDNLGTGGVRVWWHGRAHPSLIAVDKTFETY
jgi:hypothetical protein